MTKDVRNRLADDAAEDYEIIRNGLREAARATKKVWHTFKCKECGQQQKQEVEISDANAAVNAARTWLEQGFGRAAQAKDEHDPQALLNKDPFKMKADERTQLRHLVESYLNNAEMSGLSRDQ